VHCYNSGAWVDRAQALGAVDSHFCGELRGAEGSRRTLDALVYVDCLFGLCTRLRVSVTALSGCRFELDGGGCAGSECGRILRRAIDECNQSSTQWKQGGCVTSNCAEWVFDPDLRY
jgi:hypothetical protein